MSDNSINNEAVNMMTGTHYAKLIADLGMTQEGAAEFLAISGRQSRRMIAGRVPVPRQTEMLLRLMTKHGITPDEMMAMCRLRMPAEGFGDKRPWMIARQEKQE